MRNNKRLIASAFILLAATCAFASLANQDKNKPKEDKSAEVLRRQDQTASPPTEQEAEEADEVQEGVKTTKQKAHGKLYKYYGDKKLDDLPATPSGSLTIKVGPGLGAILTDAPPFDPQAFLANIGCDADAVIVGAPRDKTSHITEDETFVFTDYELTVSRVLKDNPAYPIQVENGVVVTREGGKIKYRGRTITAVNEGFRPFNQKREYLLFLKHLPNTNSYRAFANGSFQLQDHEVSQMGGRFVVTREGEGVAAFLSRVEAALATPCADTATSYKLQ